MYDEIDGHHPLASNNHYPYNDEQSLPHLPIEGDLSGVRKMSSLPPLYRDQREIDAKHVKLLAIFHFVGGALSSLKLLFLFLHFSIFSLVFSRPEMWGPDQPPPPPKEMFAVLSIFYVLFGISFLVIATLEITSGYFLWHRKQRMFSMVVAVINCLSFPLGTVLGVFTLVVLMRSTVIELYEVS